MYSREKSVCHSAITSRSKSRHKHKRRSSYSDDGTSSELEDCLVQHEAIPYNK